MQQRLLDPLLDSSGRLAHPPAASTSYHPDLCPRRRSLRSSGDCILHTPTRERPTCLLLLPWQWHSTVATTARVECHNCTREGRIRYLERVDVDVSKLVQAQLDRRQANITSSGLVLRFVNTSSGSSKLLHDLRAEAQGKSNRTAVPRCQWYFNQSVGPTSIPRYEQSLHSHCRAVN